MVKMLINAVIAVLCFAMTVLEIRTGVYPPALAYTGFGLGYVGLAWLYGG